MSIILILLFAGKQSREKYFSKNIHSIFNAYVTGEVKLQKHITWFLSLHISDHIQLMETILSGSAEKVAFIFI